MAGWLRSWRFLAACRRRARWDEPAKQGWLLVVYFLLLIVIGTGLLMTHLQAEANCRSIESNRSLIRQIVILATTPVTGSDPQDRVNFINVKREFLALIPEKAC